VDALLAAERSRGRSSRTPLGFYVHLYVANRARLKGRQQRRTRQRLIGELLLEERELGVLAGRELAAESFPRSPLRHEQ
jgi:hypothetical protein